MTSGLMSQLHHPEVRQGLIPLAWWMRWVSCGHQDAEVLQEEDRLRDGVDARLRPLRIAVVAVDVAAEVRVLVDHLGARADRRREQEEEPVRRDAAEAAAGVDRAELDERDGELVEEEL